VNALPSGAAIPAEERAKSRSERKNQWFMT
jgi:hypothetical protein